jgi:hypothetical protein
MQKVMNYGSYLQSYALKSILESLGCDVGFVDIRPGRRVVSKPAPSGRLVLDRHFVKRIGHVLFRRNRMKRFRDAFFPAIGIDRPVPERDCEKIVIGSDEVFNCCQAVSWGFSTQLLGDTAVPAFTYAASCGHATLERASALGLVPEIASALGKLGAISVRDENTASFVREIAGIEPERHLDPVLVFDWNKAIVPAKRFKNYILVYAYDNRINNPDEIRAIREFARKRGKRLMSFGLYQRWCDANIPCSPLELLHYFDHADAVVTDTFHGTVFSIKRNKPFATLIRDSNRNKLGDLLRRFDLEAREVSTADELANVMDRPVDWEKVNGILEKETARSLAYLSAHV